jgi:hypothetical protein
MIRSISIRIERIKAIHASVYIPTPRTSAPAVNAHHQNGIVEHHICSITKCVQIMLIYAMISWHDIITKTL